MASQNMWLQQDGGTFNLTLETLKVTPMNFFSRKISELSGKRQHAHVTQRLPSKIGRCMSIYPKVFTRGVHVFWKTKSSLSIQVWIQRCADVNCDM